MNINWPVKILFLQVPLAIQVFFFGVNELRESSSSMTSPKKGIKNRARSVIAKPKDNLPAECPGLFAA